MDLYVFKILDKLLELPKEKKVVSKQLFPNPNNKKEYNNYRKKDNYSSSSKNNKNYSSNKNSSKTEEEQKDMAYCLFANSGESFLAIYKKEKINIFLENISHPDKKSFISKQANDFINKNIKGKNVYLDNIVEKEDYLIAQVYLNKEKTICLNDMLKKEDLDISQEAVYMKSQPTLSKKEESFKPLNSKKTPNINNDLITGYIVSFGEANYKHEQNSNKSYFIEIELHGQKHTRWGIDLKRAIKESNVIVGDYIEIQKITDNSKPGMKNLWKINKKEDIYNHQNIEANFIPLDEPYYDTPDNLEYVPPENWDNAPSYDDWNDSDIDLNEISPSSISIKP